MNFIIVTGLVIAGCFLVLALGKLGAHCILHDVRSDMIDLKRWINLIDYNGNDERCIKAINQCIQSIEEKFPDCDSDTIIWHFVYKCAGIAVIVVVFVFLGMEHNKQMNKQYEKGLEAGQHQQIIQTTYQEGTDNAAEIQTGN